MLIEQPYSVILEGGYLELDSLNKWIDVNLSYDPIKWLFYGKTGYDYGFAEYFFSEESNAQDVSKIVSNIYTIFPNSYPPNQISRSNGYDKEIVYDPSDKDAIIISPEINGE